jgi:hypothetical protein
MAEFDQITVATHRFIRKTPKLIDMVFQNDPLLAYLKLNVREDFDGGRFIGENFYYNGLIGGSYLQGKEFDITEPQIEQQLQFNVKFFQVNVTLSKEDIQVINKGPNAAFKLIESRMTNAYMSIGAHMAIGLYLNGINANYTPNWNGLPEALNDNSTASYDGNTYSTYGTITRGGAVGSVLNSVPVNVAGTIEYNTLEETFSSASYGAIEPNIGVTTVLAYSYIKEKFQTQQRFNEVQDPKIGFNGLKFNTAVLMKSRYCPGTYISGTGDPIAVTYVKQMSNGALTEYPTLTAEPLWWLNARKPYANMYISNDPEFGLGFTGFKPGQGNTKVAGQVLAASAVTFAPRYHKQVYGITG